MKKIASILAVLTISSFIACSGSTGTETETGYVDPGLGSEKIVAIKSYSIAGYLCSGQSCGSVIYQGTLNNSSYVGFAAGKDSTNSNFTLKIYWLGTSIPASIDTTAFLVSINDGTNIYTIPDVAPDNNLSITITSGTDGSADNITVYTIDFQEPLTVWNSAHTSSITIADTASIVAYKYP